MSQAARKLVLAGGSGFLGHLLIDWFTRLNWQVVVLTRQPAANVAPARSVNWNGADVEEWAQELVEADAVVNLSGISVNCRYHARNRGKILSSRVQSTRALGEAISRCHKPPKVWLNSSTATIYKHSFDQPMDEASGVIEGTPEAKDEFSIEVARAWEEAFDEAVVPQTRKVALRTAMVFSNYPGTVYQVLRRLGRLGLGGAMDGGRQYVSWIHECDFCRAVETLVNCDRCAGVVNIAAPNPLTNREMMRAIRQVVHMQMGLPATRWMLEVGALLLRTETELIIKSRRVVPTRLSALGFEFHFPSFEVAIQDLERRRLLLSGPNREPARPASNT